MTCNPSLVFTDKAPPYQWSRTLTSFEKSPGCQFIDAHFSHGPSETGTLLIGADGYHSRTRRLLVPGPALATNHTLPIRLLGVSVIYPTSFAKKMRDLDPFFFQGGDPSTDAYMWFSFLDTPANNTRAEGDKESYECQILVSWPYRAGFLGLDDPLEVPESNIERVKLMKQISSGWTSPFKECVAAIPEDTECKIIALEDFVPKKGAWDNYEGRVTLIGDAAHAMTMCRSSPSFHHLQSFSYATRRADREHSQRRSRKPRHHRHPSTPLQPSTNLEIITLIFTNSTDTSSTS